jgi:hypothetical protein
LLTVFVGFKSHFFSIATCAILVVTYAILVIYSFKSNMLLDLLRFVIAWAWFPMGIMPPQTEM